ncbi:MAG: FHA domain-containing protein, partial [Pseudomonadota bacterium]
MVRPSSETVLKVLNGTQNGVEIELDEGEYVLGNGPDDDLQFIDLALQPGHAHLRLDGGALALKAGTGAVRTSTGLELSPGEGEWRDIDQLDIVSIGTTRFAVGAASARWADLIAAANTADAPQSASPKSKFLGWPRPTSMRGIVLPAILLVGV